MSLLVLGQGQLTSNNLQSLKKAMYSGKPLTQEQQNTLKALNQYQQQQNNLQNKTNLNNIPVYDMGYNFNGNLNNTLNIPGPTGKQSIKPFIGKHNNYFINNPNPTYDYFTTSGINVIRSKERETSITKDTIDIDIDTNAFLPKLNNLPGYFKQLAFYTTDIFKFYSTKFGVSYSVNPRPSFTRTCDIKLLYGVMDDTKAKAYSLFLNNYDINYIDIQKKNKIGLPLGRYYSNVIDNNANRLLLNFGIPKINSLANYLSIASVGQQRLLAKYGYVPTGYYLGKNTSLLIGVMAGLATFLFGAGAYYFKLRPDGKGLNVGRGVKTAAKGVVAGAKTAASSLYGVAKGALGLLKGVWDITKYIRGFWGRPVAALAAVAFGGYFVSKYINRIEKNDLYKYYDVDPTPHLYWGVVSNIINAMIVELDEIEIVNPMANNGGNNQPDIKGTAPLIGVPQYINEASMENFMTMVPSGLFTKVDLTDTFILDAYKAGIGGQKLMLGQMLLMDNTSYEIGRSFLSNRKNIINTYRVPFLEDYLSSNASQLERLKNINTSWVDIFRYQINARQKADNDFKNIIKEKLGVAWSNVKDLSISSLVSTTPSLKANNLKQKQQEAKENALLLQQESQRIDDIYDTGGNDLFGFGIPSITTLKDGSSAFIINNNLIGPVPKPESGNVYKFTNESYSYWAEYINKINESQKTVNDQYGLPKSEGIGISGWFSNVMANWMQISQSFSSNLILDVETDRDSSFTIVNESGEMEVASMINQGTQFVNQVRFNLDSLESGWIKSLQRNLDGMMQGMLENPIISFFRPLSSLLKGAFIDFPHVWKASQIEIPSKTFSIDLVSPYGNKLSQLQNIYFPLACILAGALPRSVGPASLASPFLCKAFLQSSLNIEVGLISDITITKGITNLSYNNNKQCLSINVRFTIVNLDQFISTPSVDYNGLLSSLTDIVRPHTFGSPSFSRFLGELCGRNYWNNTSIISALRRKFKTTTNKFISNKDQPFLYTIAGKTISYYIGEAYYFYKSHQYRSLFKNSENN